MKKSIKYTLIGLGALTLFSFKNKTRKIGSVNISSPVKNPKIRLCDPNGCGAFGSSRGDRDHNGVDIIAAPNTQINAPISGKIRTLNVYSSSNSMKGLEIENGNIKVKIFYVNHGLLNGQYVKKGEKIGIAQDIAAYHGTPKMTPHIHLEIYVNNKLIDPTKYIF